MKNMNFGNTDYFNTIVTQKIEGSDLLLARKRIICDYFTPRNPGLSFAQTH